jgi:predicted transcriptional regulator
MGTISIRIQDDLLKKVDEQAKILHIPKAEYIRRAVIEMNKKVARELQIKRIMNASKRVREESMKVNAEFDVIEDAPDV